MPAVTRARAMPARLMAVVTPHAGAAHPSGCSRGPWPPPVRAADGGKENVQEA